MTFCNPLGIMSCGNLTLGNSLVNRDATFGDRLGITSRFILTIGHLLRKTSCVILTVGHPLGIT